MNTSLGARTWSQVEQSTDIEVLGVPVEPTRKKQKLNPDLSMQVKKYSYQDIMDAGNNTSNQVNLINSFRCRYRILSSAAKQELYRVSR
jgi:hypothetical protein